MEPKRFPRSCSCFSVHVYNCFAITIIHPYLLPSGAAALGKAALLMSRSGTPTQITQIGGAVSSGSQSGSGATHQLIGKFKNCYIHWRGVLYWQPMGSNNLFIKSVYHFRFNITDISLNESVCLLLVIWLQSYWWSGIFSKTTVFLMIKKLVTLMICHFVAGIPQQGGATTSTSNTINLQNITGLQAVQGLHNVQVIMMTNRVPAHQ